MGHITYVRGAGSPVAIILCYFLEKNNYLFHTALLSPQGC